MWWRKALGTDGIHISVAKQYRQAAIVSTNLAGHTTVLTRLVRLSSRLPNLLLYRVFRRDQTDQCIQLIIFSGIFGLDRRGKLVQLQGSFRCSDVIQRAMSG